ncbi:MAG: hypothetical protein AAGJ70_07915 [Pseudomonadota bacterium]
MLRLTSLAIFAVALWLANSALPDANEHRRLSSFVGITLSGDRARVAANAAAPSVPSDASPADLSTAERPQSRTAADVFGDGLAATMPGKTAGASSSQRSPYAVLDQPMTTIASMPLPVRRSAITAETKPATVVRKHARAAKPDTPTLFATTATPERQLSAKEKRRIARLMQRELRRVGCYAGPGTGHWGRTSEKAMARFAAAIGSADLPTQPDYVNLILIEAHNGQACATGTPKQQFAARRTKPSMKGTVARREITSASATAMPAQIPVPSRITVSAFRPSPMPTQTTASLNAPGVRAASQSRAADAPPRVAGASSFGDAKPRRTHASKRRIRKSATLRKRRAAARYRARRIRRAESERRARRRYRRTVRAKRRARRTAGFRGSRRNWVRRAFAHRN